MAQTVLITLTVAGIDTGPFDLYSNADGYVTPFETGISRAALLAGYTSVLVPDAATIIRVKSTSVLCQTFDDLTIITTTTTTSTSTSSTTTTSTSSTTSTTSTTTTLAPNTFDGSFTYSTGANNGFTVTIGSALHLNSSIPSIAPSSSTTATITPSSGSFAAGITGFNIHIDANVSAAVLNVFSNTAKVHDNTTSNDYTCTVAGNGTQHLILTFTIPNVGGHSFTFSGAVNTTGG